MHINNTRHFFVIYDYDSGQRVRKFDHSISGDYQKQYYLRDQTGTELAVYRINGDTVNWADG